MDSRTPRLATVIASVPEMTLAACRKRYDALYFETVAEARRHSISLEIPPPSDQKRTSFGTEVRPLYDFARIELNQWITRSICRQLALSPAAGCLLRIPVANGTYRQHHAHSPGAGRDALYVSLHRAALRPRPIALAPRFRFPDAANFQALRKNAVFTLLREAQHQHGISPPCDVCRCVDVRDPKHFPLLERLVGEFSRRALLRVG